MRQGQGFGPRNVVLGLMSVLQKRTAFVLDPWTSGTAFAFAFCCPVSSPQRCLWFPLTCLCLSAWLGIHSRCHPGLLIG